MMFGPLGPGRDDVLAAMQSFYVVKAAGGKQDNLRSFLPRWGERREEITDGVDQEPVDQARGSG